MTQDHCCVRQLRDTLKSTERAGSGAVTDVLKDRKIIATIFAGEEQKKWQGLFKEIFRAR